jgi:hypothetical protein
MRCSGDNSEICGGNNAMTVSYNATLGAANEADDLDMANYKHQGCYQDNYPNSRVLSGASTSSQSMTVNHCVSFCAKSGFTIAGVENGNECYCGNTLQTDGSTYGIQSGSCTYECAGDNSQLCGGGNHVDVYSADAVLITSKPIAIPLTAADANGGCASDYAPGNNNVRTLDGASTSSNDMTVAKCEAFCDGYTYYGVEYGTECYCGNKIAESSMVASNCTTACAGDSSETCGNGWAS